MNINQATESFEAWLGERLASLGGLDAVALRLKHQAMKEDGAHAFLRATFYRWAQRWQKEGIDAPKVLSVADIHVENFGTWRDAEGRLVWGVNDFDEVCELPYTSDLVRLGVSARLAIKELKDFETAPSEACEMILGGYRESLQEATAAPFVLAENNSDLKHLTEQTSTPPEKFWNKKLKKTRPTTKVPPAARKLLEASLPPGSVEVEFREPVPDDPPGLGSRGKRRFYAFALWHGARVVRETKPVTPSALAWATGTAVPLRIADMLNSTARCPDPTQQISDSWIVRRLAPDANKIELPDLQGDKATRREEKTLFQDMGAELARLHAAKVKPDLLAKDLAAKNTRDKEWFATAVKAWSDAVAEDQADFAPA